MEKILLSERSKETLKKASEAVTAAQGRFMALVQTTADALNVPESGYALDMKEGAFVPVEQPEQPKA